MSSRRLIVGITGASGAAYGIRALELARAAGVGTHLVVSRSALLTLNQELGLQKADLAGQADMIYPVADIGAAIASGSFPTIGMLIAPCSVRTMSEIATGVTSTLMSRAADVVLKERRRLVLMLRETPLHLGHIETMGALTRMGAIIMPPVPALYAKPQSLDEMITHSTARALDLFGIDTGAVKRWSGLKDALAEEAT
ncbi:UbiX family flavin prenyltransferase [Sinorhizobium meliloti]|uniref:UbiX family flavin prenyltransferase n=1 Tax=Rhizobium meliloti TaxID=382 RepID=UPI0001E4CCE1|nr:UbiX family flavin prenyltransferase [Sinorhizobium meliloti]AEG06817.1 3-octaprenyl-4-hydroxybenzoate carboxy-lyase [Sinorhizobium meliloti BL225C]ASP54081.1 3-octaprenyl-4-hydroxybenzoate carboxy-lyase [Sinorhizobium meliloti]ASP80121.1 3-octaprenyl-4-hydroxybenzoate carboxy-lyase [Sinorhizobium meliloti]MDE3774379.1 UbiX family flavin prenyltransferase [Sinorhizobium meliloti]MDE3876094.1 UbiX family flavin prenyltransferase [Sinorhizobium meliloti]